jgi:hypothetical protein
MFPSARISSAAQNLKIGRVVRVMNYEFGPKPEVTKDKLIKQLDQALVELGSPGHRIVIEPSERIANASIVRLVY